MTAAPQFVTPAADAQVGAISFNYTVSGTKITGDSPARLMYTATGNDGKVHMYAMDLTATTVAPAPVQVSSFTIDSSELLCPDSTSASDNLLQPSTLWVVVHTNPANTTNNSHCGGGGDVYQVINYTDPASTAPLTVSITPDSNGDYEIDALYHQTGALAGIVLQQGTDLNFYASKALTIHSTLIPNINSSEDLMDVTSNGQDNIGESVAFFSVTNNSNTQMYRITAGGVATSVYTAFGSLDMADRADSTNVYASDVDATAFRVQKVPINSGVAVHKYDADTSVGQQYFFIGSNDSELDFYEIPSSGATTVQSVPVAGGQVFSTSPVATFASGVSVTDAFMIETTPGTVSTAQILFNLHDATLARSTEVITPTGTVVQAVLANSDFLEFTSVFGNVVQQVRGISTAVGSFDGGGTINTYVVGTGAITELTLSGGGAYTVPAMNQALVVTFASNASDAIGAGAIIGGSGPTVGVATDNASHLIVPITFTNTTILPF